MNLIIWFLSELFLYTSFADGIIFSILLPLGNIGSEKCLFVTYDWGKALAKDRAHFLVCESQIPLAGFPGLPIFLGGGDHCFRGRLQPAGLALFQVTADGGDAVFAAMVDIRGLPAHRV